MVITLPASKNKTDFFNLGTSSGYSTKEVFDLCQKVIKQNINIKVKPRREGDPAILVAANKKAKEILGWQPKYNDIKEIVQTAWNWELKKSS